MFTLFKKELTSFLSSLIGYIVIVVFLLITGLFLWVFSTDYNVFDFGYASIDGLFMMAPFVFLFLIPAITMRSFSDEKKTGTIELLLTKPLSDLQIITAKYLAGLALVILSLLPTLIYFLSVYNLGLPKGNIDMGGMWGSYLGLLFLGASFVSIGIFTSSITDNSIIAFVSAVVVCAFVYTGFELVASITFLSGADFLIRFLGINFHYASISRGVVDTRDVLYFLSLIAIFILMTKISLQSRKW